MKFNLKWYLTVCFSSVMFVLLPLSVHAQDLPAYESNDPLVENPWEVGTEVGYIRYKEPSLGVEFKGMVYGIYGIYNYRLTEETALARYLNVLHVDGHLDYSIVDYKGTGTASNINDFIFEPRIWLGKDFRFNEGRVTPYVGLGYRRLFDNFSSVDGGYDRISQYLYAPVGFELAMPLAAQWHALFNPEFDIFIHGWQDSQLGDSNSAYPNIPNQQKKGYGLRGSVQLWRKFNNFTFSVTPYVRYWNIKQSDIVTKTGSVFIVTGYEPANTSMEIGSKIGVAF